jgi:hypothetical protein
MMAFWLGLPDWLRSALMWTGALIVAILTGKFLLARHDERVRDAERKRQEIETAKERERVVETSHQVIEDIEDAKDRAAAAPSTVPVVSSADELRVKAPAVSKVILRDRG